MTFEYHVWEEKKEGRDDSFLTYKFIKHTEPICCDIMKDFLDTDQHNTRLMDFMMNKACVCDKAIVHNVVTLKDKPEWVKSRML